MKNLLLALLLLPVFSHGSTPTWTPTASPTSTVTLTDTGTWTPSATLTPSPTPTNSPTMTFTYSPTSTVTPRLTRTFTVSPTPTLTTSPTPTASPTRVYPSETDFAQVTYYFVDKGNVVWTFVPQGGVTPKNILWAYAFDDTADKVIYYHVDIVSDADCWTTDYPHSIAVSSGGNIDYHHGYYSPGDACHITVGYQY